MNRIQFTHLWITDFGFEPTIYQQEDFEEVELLGNLEGNINMYIGIFDTGKKQILKGYEETYK